MKGARVKASFELATASHLGTNAKTFVFLGIVTCILYRRLQNRFPLFYAQILSGHGYGVLESVLGVELVVRTFGTDREEEWVVYGRNIGHVACLISSFRQSCIFSPEAPETAAWFSASKTCFAGRVGLAAITANGKTSGHCDQQWFFGPASFARHRSALELFKESLGPGVVKDLR